ncbi:YrdB family protein [Kitasatospora phosalacinea]|uniref:YrdB family protein n=1 Tax=Kitasatospora phosalacinea TaxID=2065 RepID=A0ABW6GDE8_9ACTN
MGMADGGGAGSLTPLDAAAFVAELAVYAAVARWGWSLPLRGLRPRRPWRTPVRLLLACAAVVGLAVLWGWFAAPTADRPLHGAARVVFEVCWFGAGAAAALHTYLRRGRAV